MSSQSPSTRRWFTWSVELKGVRFVLNAKDEAETWAKNIETLLMFPIRFQWSVCVVHHVLFFWGGFFAFIRVLNVFYGGFFQYLFFPDRKLKGFFLLFCFFTDDLVKNEQCEVF